MPFDFVALVRCRFGARLRKVERVLQHAVDTDARHHRFLHHHLALGAREDSSADAGVLALGVLAHDVHVNLAGLARAAVATHDRRDDARHQTRRSQVDVLIKLPPELQQRAPERDVVGNLLGPADRAEEQRVVSANLVLPVVGQHLPVLLEVVPGGEIEVVELQIDLELGRRCLEHTNALGDDFLADAVPWDDGDSL